MQRFYVPKCFLDTSSLKASQGSCIIPPFYNEKNRSLSLHSLTYITGDYVVDWGLSPGGLSSKAHACKYSALLILLWLMKKDTIKKQWGLQLRSKVRMVIVLIQKHFLEIEIWSFFVCTLENYSLFSGKLIRLGNLFILLIFPLHQKQLPYCGASGNQAIHLHSFRKLTGSGMRKQSNQQSSSL